MSLTARLTAGMVALVILASATSATLSYRGMHQTLIDQGLQSLAVDAARTAAELDEALARVRNDVATVAAYRALDQDFRTEWMVADRPSELMIARVGAEPAYRRLIALDMAGRPLLGAERDSAGRIKLNRADDYPQQPIEDFQPAPETVEYGPGPLLRITRLSGTAVGNSFGYVMAELDVLALVAPLQRHVAGTPLYVLQLQPDGTAWAVDADGSPVPNLLPLVAERTSAPSLVLAAAAGGEPIAAAASRLGISAANLAVVVSRPLSEILAEERSMLQSTLAAAMLTIVAAVALAALLARSVSQPLARMTAAVAPGADTRSLLLPVESAGEVGVLARAFQRFFDQERLFRAITENVGDAIMTINDRAQIETANAAAEQMYGYGPGQLVGLPLNALSGEPEGRQSGDLIAAYALRPSPRPGEQGAHESLGKRRDGRVFPIEMIVSHTVVNGRLLFIAAMRDVTVRKLAEAGRTESERSFTTIFETSPALIAITNLGDNRYHEVNRSYLQTLGLDRDKVISRTSAEVGIHFRPDDVTRFQDMLKEHGTVSSCELHIKVPDGRELVVLASAEVVRIDGQQRLITTAIDITGYRQREAQLRQSQKMEAIGQLAGGIAHDFNNLLTVILGSSEILRDDAKQRGETSELIDIVVQAAERGADLTQHLLAFSRRQTLDPEVIDPNGAIRGVERILGRTVGEDITIQLSLPPQLSNVLVDRGQLESALLNLAVNARDAMPNGGIISIEADEVNIAGRYAQLGAALKPGVYVRIRVRDTGQGMPPEVVAQAFEPFFTTKAVGKGTGLGLSMVYGFVTQSGGTVTLQSELGHGTVVSMYLPVSPTAAKAVVGAEVSRNELGSERVLLVEDEPHVRELVIMQLSALGYAVDAQPDARSALAACEGSQHYDVLLTDVILPGGMNGRELADRLASARPRLRVLFTSGYSQRAIEIQGVLMPGATLLHKPFRKADLAKKVRDVISGPPYASVAQEHWPAADDAAE